MKYIDYMGVVVLLLVLFGLLILATEYEPPTHIYTVENKFPPMGPMGKELYPKHILSAIDDSIGWGQCQACNYPVTDKQVRRGKGEAISVGGG